jgi:hypothetical protein
MVVVDDNAPPVGVTVNSARAPTSAVNEVVSLQRTNQFPYWCVAELVEKVGRDHTVSATTGASTT